MVTRYISALSTLIRPGKSQALPGDSSSVTVSGDGSGIEAKVAPFPLTPALSPDPLRRATCRDDASQAGSAAREREKQVPRCGWFVRAGFAIAQPRISPLLGGEGRGEGEPDIPTTRCARIVSVAGAWSEAPTGFEPFIVSSLRHWWKSLTWSHRVNARLRGWRILQAVFLALCCAIFPAQAASPKDTTRAAMRLLKAECFSCHNTEKKKGGLVLTSRERLLEGGDEGVVVVSGQPDSSVLAKVLVKDADPHMPPRKQLSDEQIKIVREWIKSGLAWNEAALAEEDAVAPVELARLPASYQPALALALSSDGKRLAVGRGGLAVVHDASQTNYPVLMTWEAHRDAVQALAWSKDGRWLASGAFRRLALWNGESFKLEREWTNGLIGRVTSLKFSPDGDTLALADGVASQSGFVRVFSIREGRLMDSWRAHEDTIFDMDFSSDGKQLVTAGGDKLIKVWQLASKKELARLEGHAAQVLAVAFNTNATQVLSGAADKQLAVWEINTRQKINSLGKHAAALTAVAWRDEGKVIIAATDGGAVFTYKNLKMHTGGETSEAGDERTVAEGGEAVLSLAARADAKTIFVGRHDGLVQVWSDEGKLLAKLAPPTNGVALAVPAPLPQESGRRPQEVSSPPRETVPWVKPARGSAHPLLRASRVLALTAQPPEIHLSAAARHHGLLVTARAADGFEYDVTDETRFSTVPGAPFEILMTGEIRALHPGEGLLTAHARGKRVSIPVKVQDSGVSNNVATFAPPPASFLRDVLPALSKAGCNAGGCHAKPEGQNGFKLSVFSYDPKSDYAEIVKEFRGRRVFPAAPDESLLIKKPSTAVPHEGGLRFAPGSETHQLLVRWLREGMSYSITNEPVLERLVAFPRERRYRKGARQRLLVQAHYSDGSIRDVTHLAGFNSNDKEIAKVDDHGVITLGVLTGQGVIVTRYMGFVADSQILVPADRLLPEAEYASLPKYNFIDELAYAHYQQLGLLPSELCTDAEFLRRASLDTIGVLPTVDEVRVFLAAAGSDGARDNGGVGGGISAAVETRTLPIETRQPLPLLPRREERAGETGKLIVIG